MKRFLMMASALLALAAVAAPASAMPAFGNGAGQSAIADASPLIKVHGLHRVCRLGPNGWHRSYKRGRVPCVPVRLLRRY
jgi:hypothetical protein